MKSYNNVLHQIRKTTKNTPYLWPKKSGNVYSPSNAVVLDLDEEAFLKHPSKNKTRKEKELNRRRLTAVE